MHIVIITKSLPLVVCGIGDHSVLLANALRSKGHYVNLLAGEGSPGEDIYIVKDFWISGILDGVVQKLEGMRPDCLILQYTPLMFAISGRHQNRAIADFWSACSERWNTSLILHETYFRVWWHPSSLIRGTNEKRLMKRMVRNSHNVLTASQPLFEEIRRWTNEVKIGMLPIGSNVQFRAIDRNKHRSQKGIGPTDVVLTLFGGGAGLHKLSHYVDCVDALLWRNGVSARWLLLGGLKDGKFSLRTPILSPGYLAPEDLSAWLQMTDVFLMPHICGLSAKRGTLMAALQHGLPVVGTIGPMTDLFWSEVPGVLLTPMPGAGRFAGAVLKVAKSEELRREMGEKNRVYYDARLTWNKIAVDFLRSVLR